MTRPPGVWPATSELVAVTWLGTRVAGISPGQVGMTLPKDVTTWADEGFLQVQALPGGSADIDGLGRHPMLQLDAWGAKAGSDKPQWALANRLLELVRLATEGAQDGYYGMPLSLGPNFAPVRVQAAYLVSEPMRVNGDPSGYGRFTTDLMLDWVTQ